jgi:hypothetical protein
MTTFRKFWRNKTKVQTGRRFWRNKTKVTPPAQSTTATAVTPPPVLMPIDLDIAPNDPLLAYIQQNPGVFDVAQLKLNSPAVTAMREAASGWSCRWSARAN